MDGMDGSVFYVFSVRETGDLPIGKATDGSIVAFVFSTEAKALSFLEHLGDDSLQVMELGPCDAYDWLQIAMQSKGVTNVWPDPKPEDTEHQTIPADAFLLILKVACAQSPAQ